MMNVKLNESLSMSKIVHGYWRLDQWNLSKEELLKLIEEVVSLGITTMDHADIYGAFTCEEKFGEALSLKPSLRKEIQLVTKCGIVFPCEKRPNYKAHIYNTSSSHIINSVNNSLKNFNTDYIDLLLIHRPDPLMDPSEVSEAFTKLKKDGKVLNFGVSNFLPSQFNLLSSYLDFPLVTNQIEASILNLEQFKNGTIDLMLEKRISPMVWSPLAGGTLFTNEDTKTLNIRKVLEKVKWETSASSIDEIAYAWLLNHPAKMIPIVGSSNLNRIHSAVNATKIKLTKEQWFEIYVASLGHDIP
ncbi:aldo/keto reductase [Clostridium sp. HBUAS56017]|uniref:aldo/keto reductase n=1 Tax=Clostridium sp. HBUAS56017 TaxID=2571128 RepID=UPI001178536D|nr:aldo/keto reductase [Clostridium sp. HBUAS56017]